MSKEITQEQFDNYLELIIDETYTPPNSILLVPGIYEILSEYHNNDVLDMYRFDKE